MSKLCNFIHKAKQIHGDKYDYSLWDESVTSNQIVPILCPIHGSFEQRISNHIYRKFGCPQCAHEASVQSKTQSIEQIKQQLAQIHNNKYDYSLWTQRSSKQPFNQKIPILCPVHGKFNQSIRNHKNGAGCPTCGTNTTATRKTKDKQCFIDKASQIHNNKYDYSLWEQHQNSSKQKVQIICPDHGVFSQTIASHVDKQAGCPKCKHSTFIDTCLRKYDVIHPNQKHLSKDVIDCLSDKNWLYDQHIKQQKSLTEISQQLGVQDTTVGKYMRIVQLPTIRYPRSQGENQLYDFLTGNNIDVEQNNRQLIAPKELDLYLPKHNIAIEYCGLRWHSELFKDKWYHYNKWKQCYDKGIHLLTIFEDDWINKSEIVKNKLLYACNASMTQKINARQCQIIRPKYSEVVEFLNTNHIQGSYTYTYAYGLVIDQQLVAVICLRKNKNRYDITRYATNCIVRGGFSKLLKHATANINCNYFATFADLQWSTGELYHDMFDTQQLIDPDYKYIVNQQRVHKAQFRHRYLKNRLKYYDPNLTETENCHNHHLYRIYDCGKIKFTFSKKGVINDN